MRIQHILVFSSKSIHVKLQEIHEKNTPTLEVNNIKTNYKGGELKNPYTYLFEVPNIIWIDSHFNFSIITIFLICTLRKVKFTY